MLKTLGVDGVVIQAVEQFQGIQDPLVGVILIKRLLSLIYLTHILSGRRRGVPYYLNKSVQ